MAELRHTAALCGLAENPALPTDLLDHFIAAADGELCRELSCRENLSVAQARTLVERGDPSVLATVLWNGLIPLSDLAPDDVKARLIVVQRGETPESWALDLARCPDRDVRWDLADAVGGRVDVLNILVEDLDAGVIGAVAACGGLTPDLAYRTHRMRDVELRDDLARNPATPPELLAELLADGGQPALAQCGACRRAPESALCGDHAGGVRRIRVSALGNPSTPPAGIARFVDCPDVWGRVSIAERPDVPPEVYEHLAADTDSRVRGALAENPAIPERLMHVLTADPDREVRRALLENPAIPLPLLEQLALVARLAADVLPRIETASIAELRQLAASSIAQVRTLVAARTDLPADLITSFVDDPDHGVAKRIAPNPGLSPEQMWSLAERLGLRVFAKLATNPGCPPDLLLHIAEHGKHSGKGLREVARHDAAPAAALLQCLGNPTARRIAAGHPSLPAETVAALLEDSDQHVRTSAAANPNLPVDAMAGLLRHSGQAVSGCL